ncbi:MAG: PadR family transcriptional regulator [Anaerolineales bacterium]|nr:PadR family transcriptional regulator [Anaerolineales bacterium]
MSLDHAILGFLSYHPYSGYDLKKVFDVSVRHFWSADQSQIYRTLNRLTEQGLAKMEVVRQDNRPDRKVYHITAAGRDELTQWLTGIPQMDEPRSASLVQVFFLGQLSDEEALEKFEGFAGLLRMILSRYDEIPEDINQVYEEVGSARERFFWNLTLENGISSMRANLAWAESVINRLKSGQAPPK